MSNFFILGVAGGSGSGKTFFAEALAKNVGAEHAFVLYQDSYYIDQSHNFDHDGGAVNFDHPESLDFDLLSKHLESLKKGQDIEVPIYDFATHKRLSRTIAQPAKKLIIVDGILILTQPHVRKLFDDSIFVCTPEDIRYQRRLKRDVQERGRTEEGVKAQFLNQVKPMHDKYVEPSKENAGYISSGTDMQMFNKLLNDVQIKLNLV